ncbi:uncharacterized protein LY89DRAFT_732380 [Mollisia scopiformis]|uniref:Uncharacterized protein n=1 Tax=Mollisia scopiformis TaxID=149040 RepID=A0A194XGD4_MOLSC|nr:uncharacterized protein LY89DRAFT_732380 [Mollisia scopiformis]KUJ18837.1 hypothetical protein LY89DRAFT_732380 [Mollisia scopiformis]
MSEIHRDLLHVQKNLPIIRLRREIGDRCSLEDAADGLYTMIKAFRAMSQDMKDLKIDLGRAEEFSKFLQADFEGKKKSYEEDISTIRKESEKKINFLEGKISKLNERAQRHEDKLEGLRNENQNKLNLLSAQHRTALNEHQDKIDLMNAQHRSALDEKNRSIEALKIDHSRMTAGMVQSYTDKENKLLRAHEREKKSMRDEMHARQTQHKQELAEKDMELQSSNLKHEEEKDRMTQDFQRELSDRVNELMHVIEDLKGDMVKRDHFKGMSDKILADKFQNIKSEVEQFACIGWDEGMDTRWPVSRITLRNSANERRTKQYILQNALWITLYQRIFRTPFRVFGPEGKSMEVTWVGVFGKDRTADAGSGMALCPPLTKDSEKWRYENMKVCADATKRPEVDWDFNLKRDYETYLEETSRELCQELEKVAMISNSQRGKVTRLVNEAAKLWVEVGLQRCRIFLLMSNRNVEPEKVSRTSFDDHTGLVVQPELHRRGNVQGERLETDEVVMDCKGDFIIVNLS